MRAFEYVTKSGLMALCAWCMNEQGVAKQAGESHGVCPRHVRAFLSQAGVCVRRDGEGVASLVSTTSTRVKA